MTKFHELTQRAWTLLYGPGYSRKTTWIGQAAKYGYNVIFWDTDGKTNVLKGLPEDAQKRIDVIDIADTQTRPVANIFIALISRGKPFIWDEKAKLSVALGDVQEGRSYYVVYPTLMTENDIAVLDNYTDLSTSVQFTWCVQNNFDLTKQIIAKDDGGMQDMYGYCGSVLTTLVNRMKASGKNIFVIAHTTVYEKIREKKVGGQKKREVVSIREQIISSSGRHATMIPSKFQDTLKFEIISPTKVKIHTSADKDREGGSCNIPPMSVDWSGDDCKLTFDVFAKLARMHPLNPDLPAGSPGFVYFPDLASTEELQEHWEKIQPVQQLSRQTEAKPLQTTAAKATLSGMFSNIKSKG